MESDDKNSKGSLELGREEEMEVSMKHGLDMHYRIVGNRSINGLANKHSIWNVLITYPDMFPEEDYPHQ